MTPSCIFRIEESLTSLEKYTKTTREQSRANLRRILVLEDSESGFLRSVVPSRDDDIHLSIGVFVIFTCLSE